MTDRNLPIGVFDSGIGGLTVLREIRDLMPGESTVYFGDNGRTPYGTKSRDTVRKYSLQNMKFLLEQTQSDPGIRAEFQVQEEPITKSSLTLFQKHLLKNVLMKLSQNILEQKRMTRIFI